MRRIFEGEGKNHLRKGFKNVYGLQAKNDIAQFSTLDSLYKWLREDPRGKEVEAVVIALPLHLHARAAVDCLNIGKERGKPP